MNYLLTVNGEDRKGLVEALASAIERLKGNWLESRLCRLGGQFAGIVNVQFSETPSELPERVQTLACLWNSVEDPETSDVQKEEATVKILAADRPGIIKQISHVLAAHGANVEEIESFVRSAPFSGERMFEAHYTISLDVETDKEHLRDGLESLAEELMCDIDYIESWEKHEIQK
jgi:glycine cleavage system regulatory protein